MFRKLVPLIVALSGCIRLAHVEPAPRNEATQYAASVSLEVECDGNLNTYWSDNRIGTGVIISERHVLTAEHVVACPTIPKVRVHYIDREGHNSMLNMVVTNEDDILDIARLEISSAEYFNLNIPPPKLWDYTKSAAGMHACAWPRRTICGSVMPGEGNTRIAAMLGMPGDSGAGVYTDDGLLIGLIIRRGQGYTRITPVTQNWLKGT